jgi:hypothetical protein
MSDKGKRNISNANGKRKLRISFPYVMGLPQRGRYRNCTEINRSWNKSSNKKLSVPKTQNLKRLHNEYNDKEEMITKGGGGTRNERIE